MEKVPVQFKPQDLATPYTGGKAKSRSRTDRAPLQVLGSLGSLHSARALLLPQQQTGGELRESNKRGSLGERTPDEAEGRGNN